MPLAVFPQRSNGLDAGAAAAEMEVRDDDVGRAAGTKHGDRLLTGCGQSDLVGRAFEQHRRRPGNGRVVVDQ